MFWVIAIGHSIFVDAFHHFDSISTFQSCVARTYSFRCIIGSHLWASRPIQPWSTHISCANKYVYWVYGCNIVEWGLLSCTRSKFIGDLFLSAIYLITTFPPIWLFIDSIVLWSLPTDSNRYLPYRNHVTPFRSHYSPVSEPFINENL